MKIKSIILPLFAVLLAVSPVAVADEIDDYYHKLYSQYPLIHATYHDDIEEVKHLLDGGANPNEATDEGWTTLMYAAHFRHAEIVKILLAAGANLNAATDDGRTALILAPDNKHVEIVKILLAAGANPNAADNYGNTALMGAEWNRNAEVIAILQNFRPSVSPEEYIAGLQAEYCGDIAAIECQENVAEVNGEVDKSASAYECPLCASARFGDIAEVKRLLDDGANPNAVNNYYDATALIYAAFNGFAEIVKLLLSTGANPNAVDKWGKTALMHAAFYGHAEIVKMLLSAGANPNMTKDGKTALDFAKKEKRIETIAILQNFRPSVSPEEYIAGLQAEYCGDIATIECQENVAEVNGEVDESASAEEYAFRQFSEMSADEQAEFCISIRSPQRPCFCTTGIVCTENYCIDRPNCIEPEDADYKHLLNNYIPPEESVAEESANESAADESVANEPAEPETKTVCRSFANGINPDNTQWGRIGASEAGVGETEYAAIRAAIRICENDGLTECQTDLEVKCEEVAVQ